MNAKQYRNIPQAIKNRYDAWGNRIYPDGMYRKVHNLDEESKTKTQKLEDRYSEYYGEDSLVAQKLMNEYNNESATKQQEFQQYMSDTAHQREVKDLIAAGLNPQLSANAGAPAMVGAYAGVDSTPMNAAATRRIQLELQKNELANQQLLNKQNLENALIVNKYSVDKSYELGKYQAHFSVIQAGSDE